MERMAMKGQLAAFQHNLKEAEMAAVAARTLVRQNLNEWEDDVVTGCNTELAMSELTRLHRLRAKIIELRSQIDRLSEALDG